MNVTGCIRPVIFFCDHEKEYGFLSNWYHCHFTVEADEFLFILERLKISITEEIFDWLYHHKSLAFVSTEQAVFAFCKALVAGDYNSLLEAYETSSPSVCQYIGRMVNLDSKKWNSVKEVLCIYFNYLKFSQNPELSKWMLNNQNQMFVEASVDMVWSIGVDISSDKRLDVANWNGTNLMGNCLQTVQQMLIFEQEERDNMEEKLRFTVLNRFC